MPFIVTGSPTQAFVNGVRTVLQADATLGALVTAIVGHVSESQRTAYPYVVLGRRSRTPAGPMHVAGSSVSVQIDVFHGRNDTATTNTLGPGPVHTILSRISDLLERQAVTVSGFDLVEGSVTCDFEEVIDEPDADKPDSRIYHGVQRWIGEVHEIGDGQ